MNRNSIRSLALASALAVFLLLLASGGARLIGHTYENGPELMEASVPLRAALSQAPQRPAEMGLDCQRAQQLQRRVSFAVRQDIRPSMQVVSDANGNVLRCASYLHAVYQAFSLGDGFV